MKWVALLALTFSSVAVSLAHAVPANAAVLPASGVRVFVAQTVFDSNTPKSITANCPVGKRVLGGGGTVAGSRRVVLTQLEPVVTATGEGFRVSAAEDQVGENGTWSIQALAFCVDPLPGQTMVSSTSAVTSAAFELQNQSCPAGTSVVGAGGRIDGGNGQVTLQVQPMPGNTRSVASGAEDLDGFAGNWTVSSTVVCASGSFSDFRVVRAQTASLDTPVQRVSLSCPVGMRATGGGGFAQLIAHLSSIRPNQTINPVTIEVVALQTDPGPWDLIGYAICVR